MQSCGDRTVRPLTAWHCCLEFHAVSTRFPEEWRLSPDQAVDQAVALVRSEILARFRVLELPSRSRANFFASVAEQRAVGGRTYDAHVAEIARLHGARVVITDNTRHFSHVRSHGIRVLTSHEALAEVS